MPLLDPQAAHKLFRKLSLQSVDKLCIKFLL